MRSAVGASASDFEERSADKTVDTADSEPENTDGGNAVDIEGVSTDERVAIDDTEVCTDERLNTDDSKDVTADEGESVAVGTGWLDSDGEVY